jgi:hypothetical protein
MKMNFEETVTYRSNETMRLGQALGRIRDLLPLKERQQSLEKPLIEVHRAILRSLAKNGRPLSHDEIAKIVGDGDGVAPAIALLGSYDLIVRGPLYVRDAKTNALVMLDAKGGEVVGAYPLTTEKTPYQVRINGHDLYAPCAVDALSVAAIFDAESRITSRCHVTNEAVSIHQRGKKILEAQPSEVHVGVRWQRLIDCAAHVICRQVVFLKDPSAAARWLSTDPVSIQVFTLGEAIEFGEAFFRPLLED